MFRRLLLGLLLLALTPVAVATAAQSVHVFDLTQRSLVRPHEFSITYTSGMTGLRWRGWGGPHAVGSGTLMINTCKPNCADGRHVRYRAQLELRGFRRDRGAVYYAQYRVVGNSLPDTVRDGYGRWARTYVPSDFS